MEPVLAPARAERDRHDDRAQRPEGEQGRSGDVQPRVAEFDDRDREAAGTDRRAVQRGDRRCHRGPHDEQTAHAKTGGEPEHPPV
jgi:hypothetical protein